MTQHIRVDLLKEGGLFGQKDVLDTWSGLDPARHKDRAVQQAVGVKVVKPARKPPAAGSLADTMQAARGWGF